MTQIKYILLFILLFILTFILCMFKPSKKRDTECFCTEKYKGRGR